MSASDSRPISEVYYHANLAREFADGTRSVSGMNYSSDPAVVAIIDAMAAVTHAAAAFASKVEEDKRARDEAGWFG